MTPTNRFEFSHTLVRGMVNLVTEGVAGNREQWEILQDLKGLINQYEKEIKQRVSYSDTASLIPFIWLGITGETGSGKDTLGQAFVDALDPQDRNMVEWWPFTKKLKEDVVKLLISWTEHEGLMTLNVEDETQGVKDLLEGTWKEDVGRPLYQGLGEFARRTGGYDFWVEPVRCKVDSMTTKIIITPDVRYLTEAQAIQDNPKGILLTTRAENRREGEILFRQHASETEIQQCVNVADFHVGADLTKEEMTTYIRDNLFRRIVDLLRQKHNRSGV